MFMQLAFILNTQVFRTILPTIIVNDEAIFFRCENCLSNELVDCRSLSQIQAASE